MKYILGFVVFLIGTASVLCSDTENNRVEWPSVTSKNNYIRNNEEQFTNYHQSNNYNNIQSYSTELGNDVKYQSYSPRIQSTVPAVHHQYNLGQFKQPTVGTNPYYYIQSPKIQPYFYMAPQYTSSRTTKSFSYPSYSSYPTHLPIHQENQKNQFNPAQTSYPSYMPMHQRKNNYNNQFGHPLLNIQHTRPSTFNGYHNNAYYTSESQGLSAPELPVLGPNNFYTSGYKTPTNLNHFLDAATPRGLSNNQQYYMYLPMDSARPNDMTYQYVFPAKY